MDRSFGGTHEWHEEDVLITVRAYPVPSARYLEISCVAGITSAGALRRLHPIPDRHLDPHARFSKFDIVRLRTKKSEDPRPESYRVDLDAISPKIGHLTTGNHWEERTQWVSPFRASSMESLSAGIRDHGKERSASLGLIRPRSISRFEIVRKPSSDWDDGSKAKLAQESLLYPRRVEPLQFIPYDFFYTFHCEDASCKGHRMSVLDWEIKQSFRRWSLQYGSEWQDKLRQKYQDELPKRSSILRWDAKGQTSNLDDHWALLST